ncbi:MAG: hypothetical protein L0212_12930 [Acidobacteria bacterium]|nr:hypothetical protein [Acidobacteriota bacterium]
MTNHRRIALVLTLTPDPDLVPAVQGLTGRLAEQLGFEDDQRRNLTEGIGQACRQMMRKAKGIEDEDVQVWFSGYEDRVEISLENGHDATEPPPMSDADSYLLNQLLDRVVFDSNGRGKFRLTLIHYLGGAESQP